MQPDLGVFNKKLKMQFAN